MIERSGRDLGPPFPGAEWVYDLAACLRNGRALSELVWPVGQEVG